MRERVAKCLQHLEFVGEPCECGQHQDRARHNVVARSRDADLPSSPAHQQVESTNAVRDDEEDRGSLVRLGWPFAAMTNRGSGLFCLVVAAMFVIACAVETPPAQLEVYPDQTRLRVGDLIRYSVFQRQDGASTQMEDYSLTPLDPTVIQVVNTWQLEAVSAGRTELLIRGEVGERVLSIDVDPEARPPIPATHHSEVDRIAGKELLFVGHANQDGFDHTAVAKPGIDRLVREFKGRGHPVIYFVSDEYPFWYTDDRQPDLAVVTEGQEHEILVDAERIVFTGGDFMFCTLRNAQMTLHGMLKAANRKRIHFALATDAIWAVDIFTQGRNRPYPAPMALLDDLMSEHSSKQERYEQVVVPFLERLIDNFPVNGYPSDAPQPPLAELVDGWTIEVAFDNAVTRRYRRGDPNKVIVFDFVSQSST